jgi:cystathionine beta-synthase
VCVVLPDSIRNYLTKFADDSWMRQHGFASADWELGTIGDMVRGRPPQTVITVPDDRSLGDAVELFKRHGISQMPCTSQGQLSGIITETDLLSQLVGGRNRDTSIAEVMVRRVATVSPQDSGSVLQGIFERGEVAIVVDDERRVQAVLTKMDLIDFLASRARLPAKPAS